MVFVGEGKGSEIWLRETFFLHGRGRRAKGLGFFSVLLVDFLLRIFFLFFLDFFEVLMVCDGESSRY